MTKKIYEIKEKLINEIDLELERKGSIKNMDTMELGMVVDMIKDLSEAEEKCWKACYYKSVVEAMEEGATEKMGYAPDGINTGYSRGNGAMGYQDTMGYSGRMSGANTRGGYSDQSINNIRMMMETADPQRKEQLRMDLQKLMKEMGV